MPEQDKLLSTMGLAKKAGRLVYGFDTVKNAVRERKARLVLIACDVSPKTRENVEFMCGEKIPFIALSRTMEQLSTAVGKPTGVVALIDEGFVKLILGYMTDTK